ncbi:MAG: ATP-binding protein [Propionibacteriaceae bacterium]|nr:ATP-binding protein [Propionibacteriaceae bacterium]
MKKAIFLRLMALTVIAVLVCSVISAAIFAVSTQEQTKGWLTKLTIAGVAQYDHDQDVYSLSKALGNCRVTLISPDGEVLADSEVDSALMENHADRDEVRYAQSTHVTIVMRTSSTMGTKFMYGSMVASDGTIVRLAHSYSGILDTMVRQIPAMLGAITIVLLGSLVLANRLTTTVTAPLERTVEALTTGEYNTLTAQSWPYYELEKIMATLHDLLGQLSDSHHHLAKEQERVDTILSNMAEGFVLVTKDLDVLLCNTSARRFFSVSDQTSVETIHNLTRHPSILQALSSAINEELVAVFDMELTESTIATLYISPSQVSGHETGATILIVDTTAEKNYEQKKRDFFSDASHELKTPITSIIGFSEMLTKGMVKGKKDKAATIARIEEEAKRMGDLITDILTISQLESDQQLTVPTEVNMGELVREAVACLSWVKDDTPITSVLDVDDVVFYGDKRQLFHMCVNVLDNAIKYNTAHGQVEISLKEQDHGIEFRVKDTGIGIPSQDQVRVFERFFRVDYTRHKKVGGSGLGLAIVKHIVSLYDGSISLFSKKDTGTTLIITLPQPRTQNPPQHEDALVK